MIPADSKALLAVTASISVANERTSLVRGQVPGRLGRCRSLECRSREEGGSTGARRPYRGPARFHCLRDPLASGCAHNPSPQTSCILICCPARVTGTAPRPAASDFNLTHRSSSASTQSNTAPMNPQHSGALGGAIIRTLSRFHRLLKKHLNGQRACPQHSLPAWV